jgi:hypothetical protein
VGRDGDTSFPEFHRGLDSRGASVCFWGRVHFLSLFPSLLLFRTLTFFDIRPWPYSFVFHSFLQPGAAVASLGASLCFLATPPLFVSVPVPGELPPRLCLRYVRNTISRLGLFFFPFSIRLLLPGSFLCCDCGRRRIDITSSWGPVLALDPTRPGLREQLD